MAFRRRTAGYRARIRRKARHPSATAALAAWSEYLPSRRASAFAASAASRRMRLLRLVSPPPRHASRQESATGRGGSIPRQGSAERKSGSSKRCKRRRLRRAKTGMYRQRASGGAQASGARAQSAARARQTPRGGVADAPKRSGGKIRRSRTRRVRKHPRAGRYPDQAMQAAFADGCSARDQRRLRGGGARRSPATQSRPCQRWRITRPPAERP